MAVHVRIKTWLQDNGYPIRDVDWAKKKEDGTRKVRKECRKEDFSMRLFAAYCDSEIGYDYIPKDKCGREADEDWKVINGFCVWKPEGVETFLEEILESMEQEGREDFYIPLAVDLYSGYVFFLAGKGYYKYVYEMSQDKRLQKTYENEDAFFCYDYLRLDEELSGDSEDFGNPEVAFRLQPTFHENAGKRKSYEEVLGDFMWYCENGNNGQRKSVEVTDEEEYYIEDVSSPRWRIRFFNDERPDGIPEAFWRIFYEPEDLEDSGPSEEAKEDFGQAQEKFDRMQHHAPQ